MKTNYKILVLTFVINIFMALSLNSFNSPALYLPMMFLYFLSGLASFIDKIAFYIGTAQKTEERISWIGFYICFLGVCLYIANSLGFIEIIFQCNCGTYKVLIQGIQNSFFTFNSINITPVIFSFAFMLPFMYLALCLVSYLREQGLTMGKVISISKHHKIKLVKLLGLSFVLGVIGCVFCYFKYINTPHNHGTPQYHKYFLVAFGLCFVISHIHFYLHHKND